MAQSDRREPINVTPEAKRLLRDLLMEPEMRGVGYSEFILKAVGAARERLEKRRAYTDDRRRMVRSLCEREMSDEECDALLAKMDAVSLPRGAGAD